MNNNFINVNELNLMMASLFFYASKIFWFLIAPGHFLILCICLGLLLSGFGRKFGKWLIYIPTFILTALLFFPLGNLLLLPLEKRFSISTLPQSIAGVVILGGGEYVEVSKVGSYPRFGEAAERIMSIAVLRKVYPYAPMIYTGGSGDPLSQNLSGASNTKALLDASGMGKNIKYEFRSRNTYENALNSRLLAPNQTKPWLLVTSAFHMPRAMGVFRKAGWNVYPYPTDFRVTNELISLDLTANLSGLNVGMKEWVGLLAYKLTDKIDSFFPALNPNE